MTKSRDLANAATALNAVTAAELTYLDGVTSAVQTQIDSKQAINANVSTTELGYLDGVTSAIQTQLDAKLATATATSTYIPKTLTTTTGDIIYASGANTPARLGIGSSAQVLTVSSGVPAWTTLSGGGGMTLLSTTSLSGTSTTVSSISTSYKALRISIKNYDTANNANVLWRFNGDSGSNYHTFGLTGWDTNPTTGGFKALAATSIPGTDFRIGSDSLGNANIIIDIFNYNDSKSISQAYFMGGAVGAGAWGGSCWTKYNGSAGITSFTLSNLNSESQSGTIEIYGVN
jgi:hypothetical protein